jgi:large subunit ribosomal protein L13
MIRKHTHSTKAISAHDVQPGWKLVNAEGAILGKVASEVAGYLQGKHKTNYVTHIETGDHVVIINAAGVVVTGRKGIQKTYTNYSGYPGGLKKEVFQDMLKRRPTEVVRRAVSGMLPKNKLRDRRLARLHIYVDSKHPYAQHFVS